MLEAILGNELFTLCTLAYKTPHSQLLPFSFSSCFPRRTANRDVPAPGPPRTKMTVILLASKTGVSENLTVGALEASGASGALLLVSVAAGSAAVAAVVAVACLS